MDQRNVKHDLNASSYYSNEIKFYLGRKNEKQNPSGIETRFVPKKICAYIQTNAWLPTALL